MLDELKVSYHHISDFTWSLHKLGYTGSLSIQIEDSPIEIFFEDGQLVQPVSSTDPLSLLKSIAEYSHGSIELSDDKKTTSTRKISITNDIIDELYKISLTAEGYPAVSFSSDVDNSVIEPTMQITKDNIMPEYINRIIEYSKSRPTIGDLSKNLDINSSDLISVLHSCLSKGVIKLQDPSGSLITRSTFYRVYQPNRFTLTFKAKVTQNSSLTATQGTVHISRNRLKQMESFRGNSPVEAVINNVPLSVKGIKLSDHEVMISKPDITKAGLETGQEVIINLTKED
jgi:hypothetical protein